MLETTFRTASGVVRVTDSLNTGVAGRLPWAELARRVDGVEGSVALTGRIAPGTALNTASPWMHETVHGQVLRLDGLTLAPRTLADDGVEVGDRDVVVRYTTAPGSRHLLGLVATEREAALPAGAGRHRRGRRPDGRQLAALDGHLQLGRPVGARRRAQRAGPQAADLRPDGRAGRGRDRRRCPSRLDGGKNWDYRYAWIRDMAYSLTALFRFGVREETHSAMSWLLAHDAALRRRAAGLLHAERRPARHRAPPPRRPRLARHRPGRRRQRGQRPAAARRVRRRLQHRQALRRPRQRPRRRHRPAARRHRRPRLRPVAQPRLGDVGAARPAALHDVQAGLLARAAAGRRPRRRRAGPGLGRPLAQRGRADPHLGGRERLVRRARRLPLVPGQRPARRLDPAARHQRLRPRRADVLHPRRAPPRAGPRPAPLPLHRCRRGGGPVRRLLLLDGLGPAAGADAATRPAR